MLGGGGGGEETGSKWGGPEQAVNCSSKTRQKTEQLGKGKAEASREMLKMCGKEQGKTMGPYGKVTMGQENST